DAHGQRRGKRGGDGERRADAKDLQRHRVGVDDRRENMPEICAAHREASLRSVSRNGPKPFSPSQKRTRLATPVAERVAPVMPSTSYSPPPRAMAMRIVPVSSATFLPIQLSCQVGSAMREPKPGVSACS